MIERQDAAFGEVEEHFLVGDLNTESEICGRLAGGFGATRTRLNVT